jgi:predicted ATPase/DNA-binding SARP family transcriptional activator/tetratricopeptide (TPR) repeat protein
VLNGPGGSFRPAVSRLSVKVRGPDSQCAALEGSSRPQSPVASVRGVEFRILGPLEVAAGGRQVQISGSRERALLAILLIHIREVVSADRLIEELWGSDLPSNPSNALQVVVSRVRKILEAERAPGEPAEFLVTRKPGYQLDVTPDDLDAGQFGELLEEAQQVAPADQVRRLSLLEQALGLWRGPALTEFALESFAREEIARLEEARLRAVELMAEAKLALGRHAELVAELKALVAANPLRERLRGHLMLALYRSGRQGDALRVFQEGRSVLVAELGVDPGPQLRDLQQQILLQAASLSAVPETAAPRSNLPAPVTSFVGRHLELQQARKLLTRSRLVTLTGTGGCGKTRLAIELARTLTESFPDGVWLVELEAVSDPALVLQSLAAVLGIGEGGPIGLGGETSRPLADKLIDYLRGKELLLVLDNCEHLIEACAQVAETVLRSAPKVRFLTTSRERLGAAGEALWPVPPLGVPGSGELSAEQLARSDAVQLFLDRATAVQPAFALDAGIAPAVSDICRRLDGIPLAIELAAARVRILPPPEIAARLDDRFSLLTGNRTALPRHQTLQAAIDWSYQLLSGPERELFGRLSVFAGGFTLEAAEEVGGDEAAEQTAVLELLSRLVDQSLVVHDDAGHVRFRMLETLRRYAAERLAESGTAGRLRRRHAEYLLRLAERAEPLLRGPQQAMWMRRLEADHDNFNAAIDWALRHDPEVAVRLCSALAYFWLIGRHRSEVRRRLGEVVEMASNVPPAQRVRALAWSAQLANVEGRLDQAASQAQEAYELSTDAGDPWWIALCEVILGLALGLRGQTGRASQLLEAGRARFREIGDNWGTALASMLLGYVSSFAARHDQAAALARQSLDGFRAAADQWGQTMALELLGVLARRRGAYEDAIPVFAEALGVVRDLGLDDEAPFLLADLADLHTRLGNFETAAVLHKEALDLANERGASDAAALARTGLALAARRQGHYERARELHLQALSYYQEANLAADIAHSLASLGYVEELSGDLDAATACHQESLRLARDLPDEALLAFALEGLACVAATRQQPQRTAVLLGAAESIRTRTGTPLPTQDRADIERATEAAVRSLGREAFTRIMEQSRRMNAQEATTYAVSDS